MLAIFFVVSIVDELHDRGELIEKGKTNCAIGCTLHSAWNGTEFEEFDDSDLPTIAFCHETCNRIFGSRLGIMAAESLHRSAMMVEDSNPCGDRLCIDPFIGDTLDEKQR